MRRVVSSTLAAVGLAVAWPAAAAAAAPSPAPSAAGAASSGNRVCTVTDDRLGELSGMVATRNGFIVVNDSSQEESRKRIFFLDRRCEVTGTRTFSGGGPRDPEDLGLAPDGETLFVADIGDNDKSRNTVALWTMPVDGSEPPVLNRLTYPDGKHDAEALLFDGDGTPIIVTRESGKAGLYSPSGPLRPGVGQGVPMVKRGEVTWPKTTTVNQFLGPLAQLVITGGATSADGTRVALRTYADAFEWEVTNGDVVAALTRGRPRYTPLPDEPRGEAITYSPDGAAFLTVSEVADQPAGTQPEVRRYAPSSRVPVEPQAAPERDDDRSWLARLSLQDITYVIAGLGLLGALLLGAGVFGILRARRAAGADDEEAAQDRESDGADRAMAWAASGGPQETRDTDRGRAAARWPDGPDRFPPAERPQGSAGRAFPGYGGGPPPGAVYGGQPPRGGATYGGQRPPGGAPYGGQPPSGRAPYGGQRPPGGDPFSR